MERRNAQILTAGGILVVAGLLAVFVLRGMPEVGARVDGGPNVNADVNANANANANANVDANTGMGMGTTSVDAGLIPSAVASARRHAIDAAVLETSAVDAGHEGGAAKPGPLNLDEGAAGKTVDVAVGQSIVLLLGASPTSGFDWAVMKAPAALGAPAMGFIEGGTSPGAPGKRRLTWTCKSALPAGEHVVQLGYARSFEPGVAPFKTFQFKVRSKQ